MSILCSLCYMFICLICIYNCHNLYCLMTIKILIYIIVCKDQRENVQILKKEFATEFCKIIINYHWIMDGFR